MIKAMIEKIQDMNTPEIINVNDREYSSKPIYPVKTPIPDAMCISTLTGIVDYLDVNLDRLPFSEIIVHVQGYNLVAIKSNLYTDFAQRATYLVAESMTPDIRFGQPMRVKQFIIQLQSMFVKSPERDNLLKFLGSLKAGFSKTMSDDGVSQTVTAKTGVTMVSEVAVPSPVSLQPYRTFPEIEQPVSDYVFRIHAGQDEPMCALYEADGGAWKLVAIKLIAGWIKGKLPNIAVVA